MPAVGHLERSGSSARIGVATAHQSDLALAANEAPILYPSDAREIIAYGLAALSRYSGLVVGLKRVNETADCTQVVDLDVAAFQLNPQGRVPSLALDEGSVLTQSPAILEYLERGLSRTFSAAGRSRPARPGSGGRGDRRLRHSPAA